MSDVAAATGTGAGAPLSVAAATSPATVVGATSGVPAPRARGLWYYLGVSLSTVLLLAVLTIAMLVIVIPKATGALPMTVLTSSMEPGLPAGTLIIVKPIDPDALAIGDVATYQIQSGKRGVITHRIIAINLLADGERSFLFQGDNNSAIDDPVRSVQIQGKLWYAIPLLGWVNNVVNGENRSWIMPVAASLLFAYAGYSVASAIAESVKKRRKAAAVAASAEDDVSSDTSP
jgi:signal peptidase